MRSQRSLLSISAALMLASSAFAREKNPDRNAYFGETHIHTSWSVDAWLFGNRVTGPDDALKYAQGQTIKHPLGYDIKVDTPMDFIGVTDHSEYVPVALLFFNVGVEIGQLLFIAAVLSIMALGRFLIRRAAILHPAWAWRVAPHSIGGVAAFWMIQRIAAF